MDTKPENCFRIYFQNINGLTTGNSLERWSEHVTTMKEKYCDIFGLVETNTNWQSNNIKTDIDSEVYKQFSTSSTNLSSNRYNPPSREKYLPGGTLQTCTGHWTSRCMEKIHDSRNMGRWSGHKFRFKNSKTLTLITAYRPCKKNSTNNKSTSTATYRQQTIMLAE
jgi:hypothetical protein